MNGSFTALITALSRAPTWEECAFATCPLPEENTSWVKYKVTVFLPASLRAISNSFRESVCTWELRLRLHGSGRVILPSVAISPAKDTNTCLWVKFKFSALWTGPHSTELTPSHYINLIGDFKGDNKVHKPLHPEAHVVKRLAFPKLPW